MGNFAPRLDQRKSFAGFFNAIRPAAAQRTLYSTFCDDRRLPLVTYYLGRRPEIVTNEQDIFKLLRSGQALGIVIGSKYYQGHAAEFAAIPHRAITAPSGKNVFTFVIPDDPLSALAQKSGPSN